jgi:hypothetical protein
MCLYSKYAFTWSLLQKRHRSWFVSYAICTLYLFGLGLGPTLTQMKHWSLFRKKHLTFENVGNHFATLKLCCSTVWHVGLWNIMSHWQARLQYKATFPPLAFSKIMLCFQNVWLWSWFPTVFMDIQDSLSPIQSISLVPLSCLRLLYLFVCIYILVYVHILTSFAYAAVRLNFKVSYYLFPVHTAVVPVCFQLGIIIGLCQ